MRKATNKGTCQICGSVQKLPGGVLSNHGYTVDWGCFNGTCNGSGNLPFELSCDMVRGAIESAKADIIRVKTEAVELGNATGAVAWMHNYYRADYYSAGGYVWERCTITMKEMDNGFGGKYQRFFYQGINKTDVKEMNLGGYDYSIKSVADMVKFQNERYIKKLLNTIKELNGYIDWQNFRIKDWKPAPLKSL